MNNNVAHVAEMTAAWAEREAAEDRAETMASNEVTFLRKEVKRLKAILARINREAGQ